MQQPKNVMQIGEPGRSPYIYIEDYAYTYVRQIAKSDTEGWHKINLYGDVIWENNEQYYFIYAALTVTEECEEKKRKFFPEYQFLGTLKIQDTIIEFAFQEKEPRIAGGFYVFFEKNLLMQSYMIWEHENKEKESVKKVERENVIPLKEYAPKKNKESNLFTGLTVVMGILVCAIIILTMNRYEKMRDVKDYYASAMEQMEQKKTAEKVQVKATETVIENLPDTDASSAQMTAEFVTEPTTELLTEEIVPAWVQTPVESDAEKSTDVSEESTEEMVTDTKKESGTEAAIPNYEEYIIEEGDTLLKICVNYYGNDSRVEQICQLNNIQNPDNIKPGQKILLPQ